MKTQKGITLIALVVTIVVLLILSTVGITAGMSTYESSKFTAFTTELEMLQTQVNEWNQKYLDGDIAVLELGKELNNSDIEQKTFREANITDTTGYRYFDKETISKVGLEGIRREFLVNIAKRIVICYGGYTYKDKTYYTINQLPNSLYNVNYIDKTSGNIVVGNVYVEANDDNSWDVYIENVQYPQYVSKAKIEYQKSESTYWNVVQGNKFTVREPGIYYIRITAANSNINIVDSIGNVYSDNKIQITIKSETETENKN